MEPEPNHEDKDEDETDQQSGDTSSGHRCLIIPPGLKDLHTGTGPQRDEHLQTGERNPEKG